MQTQQGNTGNIKRAAEERVKLTQMRERTRHGCRAHYILQTTLKLSLVKCLRYTAQTTLPPPNIHRNPGGRSRLISPGQTLFPAHTHLPDPSCCISLFLISATFLRVLVAEKHFPCISNKSSQTKGHCVTGV